MVNLAQGPKSVSSGLVRFLKSILARFVLKVDADEAAAALAKDVERKARDAARAKARRDFRRKKVESADSKRESADSILESADSKRESADESADPPHTPPKILKIKKRGSAPIDENWWPDEEGYKLGSETFGADGVDAAIRKHRDIWASRPEERTPPQWQALWRAWCRSNLQPSLRLPPQVVTRERSNRKEPPAGFYAAALSSQLAAWDAYERRTKGRDKPRDRNGGWWVESEWPPDHDETRQAS